MERRALILIVVVVAAVVLLVLTVSLAVGLSKRNSETFHDDLVSRCEAYRKKIYTGLDTDINCEKYMILFKEALSTPGSACRSGTFKSFMKDTITSSMFQAKETLLWSGKDARDTAEQLFDAGKPFIPVSRVLAGYIMAPYNFCNGTEWAKYKGCEGCTPRKASFNFWSAASERFASLSDRTVHVLLNSPRVPLVNMSSILTTVELPNLRLTEVKKVIVYVYGNKCPDKKQCERPSVKELRTRLEGRSFKLGVECKSCTGLPDVSPTRKSSTASTLSWAYHY